MYILRVVELKKVNIRLKRLNFAKIVRQNQEPAKAQTPVSQFYLKKYVYTKRKN